jgi:CheY-like chemotaxis protein
VAGDGRNGLFLAIEHPVSAIILDLKLPDIDGINVLDHLKNDLRTRHIPVHIISASDEGEGGVPLRKGAIGYLTKPADKEAVDGVFTRIESLLQADIKHVLIVEDDKNNQLAIQKLLGKRDLQLTLASSGEEGCKALKSSHFDCIILDLQLPDMTGFEWLERMEKDCTEQAPPVVVYTARELSEEENRELNRYTGSIVIKGARSPERLLDEVTLFLHSVGSALPEDQQEMLRMQHNPDKMLEGRTILLADDDLRNTFALSKLLKKHGLNVIIADNGEMALEKLEQNPGVDLVITDIMMPVMDGYQAMQEIRARYEHRLPIIALTARAMPEEQEKCIAAGANDYLSKPVDIERLLLLLRVWLFKQDIAA